ncbi:MAG: type I restriction-modification system subunit M [Croceicoccus sp.]|nr:type I restriction-modification system subunit M [Croceicoccus sp.]|tara:strand:- start:10593 stop:12146 length:1554 start_codon:yes stop_codon:yes gene_type:complete
MTRPEDINNAVWAACDTFRGVIDAEQYKNYILALLFLKYISDVWNKHYEEMLEEFRDHPQRDLRIRRRLERERFKLKEIEYRNEKGEVVETFLSSFDSLYERRNRDNVGELINMVLDAIEQANEPKLNGVFRNIDFNSEISLGQTKDRNRRLKNVLEDFAKPSLNLSTVSEDAIGEAYIYLIEQFAADAGKKAGEFFTPRKVSEVVAKLAAPRDGALICDPACGSGSLLLRAGEEVGTNNFRLYGQEANGQTVALARMNMFLHGRDAADIRWCDTINGPTLLEGDHLMRFDTVVANPPFSLDKWGAENAENDPFRRFARGVPPKSKGDYAFILHMLAIARPGEGRVAFVAPHGVLFRGGAEGRIRESIVRDNLLDVVVGLPAQLFPTTGIPVCIMVFDRAREAGGARESERDVLFIDASREFGSGKRQNQLRAEDAANIVSTAHERIETERYSHRASFEEIERNKFNLNIPRYVDTFEPEPEIDIQAVQNEIRDLDRQLAETRAEMNRYLKELGIEV